ncbi:MAG: glycosyltransferase family 4 protein [Actinomycetia bacterium]|nr:glycosyltransferase family 4 protein [Actinomycetes bacterium]MCP4960673.1 glycosyltransferase family 4 protein [Actinomycetes bacterium]
MRILVSALYCKPNSGSEQAYGWWWVTELARHHDVVVMTGSDQRPAIEEALADRTDLPRLHFEYVTSLVRQSPSGTEQRFERLAQYLWQLLAAPRARQVARRFEPDVAHHVTSGTWRQPSCLAATDIPFAMGPLAGSERLPAGFAKAFGREALLRDRLRGAAISVARVDPLVNFSLRRSKAIIAAGTHTKHEMQRRFPDKIATFSQVFRHPGVAPGSVRIRSWTPDEELRIVWVGRIVPSKGLQILLDALSDPRLPTLRLDVLGAGPERERMEALTHALGLEDRVHFRGHVDHVELFDTIHSGHLFVFTSLQELMGQALSEAMQLGIGCIVFDYSGASVLAGSNGAVKVPIRSPQLASSDLADAIVDVIDNNSIDELSRMALDRFAALADDGTPQERMERLYRFTLGETK